MIRAVLLDLDNTLLINPDAAFASAFLQRIDSFFMEQTQYDGASRVIRQMMKAFAEPRAGTQSNWMLARDLFATALNTDSTQIERLFATFYASVYPKLENCTRLITGADDLVRRLRAMNLTVVIATNPIYPADAIRQRMAWASLPDDNDLYALITTAEVMHFAKPDAAYYAEIIARVGVEPEDVLMVGDSLRNDILPAQVIGLHTFHIDGDDTSPADASGTLVEFIEQVSHEGWLQARFTGRRHSPEMIVPQYRGNIGALYGLLEGVQPHMWHKRPSPDEWSILQLLCHLCNSEDTHQRPRLERILRENNPFIVAPQAPGPDLSLCDEDGHAIAAAFVATRGKTIDLVASLTADDWQRPARHSIFGLTTLLEMAHFTAQHDRLHLTQLCQTIGRCQ
jgi:FMN phosphatase YigB (HAD superfamily)